MVAEAEMVVDVPGKVVVGVPVEEVAVGLAGFVTVTGVPVLADAAVLLADLVGVTVVKELGVVGVGAVGVVGGIATGLMVPKESGVIVSLPLW